MIAGVCGGLAEWNDSSVDIWRAIFLILALAGGAGIVLYLVLWALLAPKPDKNHLDKA